MALSIRVDGSPESREDRRKRLCLIEYDEIRAVGLDLPLHLKTNLILFVLKIIVIADQRPGQGSLANLSCSQEQDSRVLLQFVMKQRR